jgi:hypothetical protein
MPTREQTKELLPILTAYADGKVVEFNGNEDDMAPYWGVCEYLHFTHPANRYRVKPEPTTRVRPFTLDEFRTIATGLHWVKLMPVGRVYAVTALDPSDSKWTVQVAGEWWTLEELADGNRIVNPDGTESPFGVVEVVE